MEPIRGKRGFSQNIIKSSITGFVLLAVLFLLVAALYPTAAAAGDDLNASGFPLGNLLVGGGVVFLVISAAMVIGIITHFMGSKK